MTVAGVDLGGSKIAGVLLDESGTVRGELWQEHRIQGPDQAVELIAEVVGELMAREPAAARVAGEPASGPGGRVSPPPAGWPVSPPAAGWPVSRLPPGTPPRGAAVSSGRWGWPSRAGSAGTGRTSAAPSTWASPPPLWPGWCRPG